MPLIPCKLSFKDCQPILDKILARIISLGLPKNCSLLEDSNYYNMYSATFKDFGLVSSYYLKINSNQSQNDSMGEFMLTTCVVSVLQVLLIGQKSSSFLLQKGYGNIL